MKIVIITLAAFLAMALLSTIPALRGCNSRSDGTPVASTVVLPPDNTIRLPRCRVIYIGVCPYAWCAYGVGSNGPVASAVPMRYNCDPGSAVVSTHRPADSEWEPKP
jgi:hypothetical protein